MVPRLLVAKSINVPGVYFFMAIWHCAPMLMPHPCSFKKGGVGKGHIATQKPLGKWNN